MNLALLETCLRPLGHELVRASGGREALRSFHEHPPDLVLLDYVMPDLDGIEVLKEMRLSQAPSRVPVVLITAHSDREHRVRGLEAGADEFLEKPLDRAVLLARVRMLLKLKASNDALAASHQELELRHRALEQAQAEQRELTAFIVHDLKNPLSVVCAGLDFAHEDLVLRETEVGQAIADSRQAAERLSAMVSDILTISRMEAAEFTLHREAITVSKLLRSVVGSYVRRAVDRGIVLAQPTELSMQVHADRPLLQRVLENVIDNAFRYTPAQGRIAVDARPGSGVEIWVSNDGPPIPPIERERIFEKFRRGDAENASRSNAGLGLYFCRRAVEAHGGAIEVVDDQDFSTSFRISLPA